MRRTPLLHLLGSTCSKKTKTTRRRYISTATIRHRRPFHAWINRHRPRFRTTADGTTAFCIPIMPITSFTMPPSNTQGLGMRRQRSRQSSQGRMNHRQRIIA
ncbi:unnamed protein product [Aphanomyces euteiches]